MEREPPAQPAAAAAAPEPEPEPEPPAAPPPAPTLTAAAVRQHDGEDGRELWAVIDGYVLDVTEFVSVHPGGPTMIQEQPNRDCSGQFRIHFGSTVADLKTAFAAFDAQETQQPPEPLRHVFIRSRKNGGLGPFPFESLCLTLRCSSLPLLRLLLSFWADFRPNGIQIMTVNQ